MRRSACLALLAIVLAGCVSVGPDYERVRFDAPATWMESSVSAEAAPDLDTSAWWKSFDDPVLTELITQAVNGNPDVTQAIARIDQARADAAITRAAALPALNVSAATTSSYSDSSSLAAVETAVSSQPVTASTTYQVGSDVSWELDMFGGQRRKREASRAELEASVEDMRAVVLTLLGDVASNYIELRQQQQRLLIARASAASQKDNVEVTRERSRIGLTSQLDVFQAQAQFAAIQADIPTREASVRQAIHRLGVLLGREPEALASQLSATQPLPSPERVYAPGLPSELLDRRPDLRKAEHQLAAASANIGVAAAEQYPAFDLTMGIGIQGNVLTKFLGLANWYWSVIPAVSAPVFDAGKARADVKKKQAAYVEALAGYRSAWLVALEDVENALTTISTEQERKQSLTGAVKANEEALALARERYGKGLTNFLDVLSAEKSLYEAQDNECTASANVLLGMVKLYKTLGGGWNCQDLPSTRTAQR
jgi:NodT family efflux transporter outer membrane factor (OMF) lipoprotein